MRYTAVDISVGDERAAKIVNSAACQKVWADYRLPLLARSYLCLAQLSATDDDDDGERAARRAFWERWAAWACEGQDARTPPLPAAGWWSNR